MACFLRISCARGGAQVRRRRRHPDSEKPDARTTREVLRQIPWFMGILWWASPWAVAVNVGVVLLIAVLPTLQIEVNGRLIDAISQLAADRSLGIGHALFWVALLIGTQTLRAGLASVRGVARARLRERAGVRLQQLIIARAGSVPLEQYEQAEFYDRLQRAQQAATWRSFVIFDNMLSTVERIVDALSLLVLILMAHYSIAILLTLGAIPVTISHLRRGKETYALRRRQTPRQRKAQYHVEVLTNREAAKEIRLYGLGKYLTDRWEELASQLRRERLDLTVRQQIRLGVARLISVLSYSGTIVILAWLGLSGRITAGSVVKYIETANRFPAQLTQVMRNISTLFEELLYLSDLREFVEMPTERREGLLQLEEGPAAVEFENVSFNYPGGPKVLRNINFRLRPGEKVALVGLNGAGKTTLIKLLLGLYTPTEGRILVNGVDMRQIDPDSVRSISAAVFQDYLKYQLTARQNIGFGRAEAVEDQHRIQAAAEAAGAVSIINELPQGYETILGRHFEGGKDLSGGQWQRLALSRAYFREAHVLVLDEPTAALDPRAELAVFEEFSRLAEGKTAVFVSHRMASARIADRVMVLRDGLLVEFGSHEELLHADGEYARMFRMQAQWYVDEPLPSHTQRNSVEGLGGGGE